MTGRATVVLDVGKTHTRLTLWAPGGQRLDHRKRANPRVSGERHAVLDAAGIEVWVARKLQELAHVADIGAIIPVAHGAAAAIIRNGALAQLPLDYEHPIPPALRRQYDEQRDDFSVTGSPALPLGLNLGAQLHYLETLDANVLKDGATLLPWPQYWSWLLSGVPSAEVTSLGCHTDLWQPLAGTPSSLAQRRGWADSLAPLTSANAVVGQIAPAWAARTGLPRSVEIHCGLHDSNAALVAARGFDEIASGEATVLSTGTWFVAMRSLGRDVSLDIGALTEKRDCLMNVDAAGRPVPSARFMGGREIELLQGSDTAHIDVQSDQAAILAEVPTVLASGAMAVPTLAPGSGPFANAEGGWISRPRDEDQRRAAISLYAALIADVSLDLIGSRGRLLVEGRFSGAEVFTRALATLRPHTAVYVDHVNHDASFGALRLVDTELPPPAPLTRVLPLPDDLHDYRRRWRDNFQPQ